MAYGLVWSEITTRDCRQYPPGQSRPPPSILYSQGQANTQAPHKQANPKRGQVRTCPAGTPKLMKQTSHFRHRKGKYVLVKRWKNVIPFPYLPRGNTEWLTRISLALGGAADYSKFCEEWRTQRRDMFLVIITSFLELSCDVELTLHFSFHNKNNLLFYGDDAVRIQLWKQMKCRHSPSILKPG